MANIPPSQLKPTHLLQALLPESPDVNGMTTPIDATTHYTLAITQLDQRLRVIEGWRGRLQRIPSPPQPASLAELIQTARKRLAEDKLSADGDELVARRFVLTELKREIGA